MQYQASATRLTANLYIHPHITVIQRSEALGTQAGDGMAHDGLRVKGAQSTLASATG